MKSAHGVATLLFAVVFTAFPNTWVVAGDDEKPVSLGKFRGYFFQRKVSGVRSFYIQMELDEKKDVMSGTVRLELVEAPGSFFLAGVTGNKKGDEIRLKDNKVIETVNPPAAVATGWLTARTFDLKLNKYGRIEGVWSDRSDPFGDGTLVLTRMDFNILVERKKKEAGLVTGDLSLNGTKLGEVYENADKLIPAGSYNGRRRFVSSKLFVQNFGGQLAKSGDFLLEIADVPNRTDILFHPGNKPAHSTGCILAGPAKTLGKITYAPDLLKEMRLHFYGKDAVSNPMDPVYVEKEKNIKIEIRDISQKPQEPVAKGGPGLQNPLNGKDPPKLQNPLGTPKTPDSNKKNLIPKQ